MRYASFAEFYPFYLSQHADRRCRRWHFIGSTLGIICVLQALLSLDAWWLLGGLVSGYACAWIGHFFFEKNRPATFTYPVYSFAGDWLMYWQMLQGKLTW